nr:hypothetical protein [uncultured Sphingomonas sp.]
MSAANLLVTALTLLAVLLARHGLGRLAQRSDVARRLRTLYALVAALLLCRLVSPVVGGTVLTAATMLLAAWLPLAALRLVEELTRRHAGRRIKLFALGGAVALSAVAITVGLVWSIGAIVALAAFQALMLLLMVAQLIAGRRDLGQADRQAASAILAALLLAVPLVLTDFRALLPDLEVRGGSFAVLLLLLAASAAGSEPRALRRFPLDLILMMLAGGVALLGAEAAGVPPSLSLAGPVAAFAALLLIVERLARQQGEPAGLVAALARVGETDRGAVLAAHPLLAAGRLLGPVELALYPAASIAALLRNQVTSIDHDDPDVRALARELLLSNGATHLIRTGKHPPELLAIAAGELSGPDLTDELAIAGRLLERSHDP